MKNMDKEQAINEAKVEGTITPDERAELERLRAENAKLKAKASGQIYFKVSEKSGAISAYGVNGRFPTTLYKSQWDRLFEAKAKYDALIESGVKFKASKDEKWESPTSVADTLPA